MIRPILEQQVDRFRVIEFGRDVEEGVTIFGQVGDVTTALQEHPQVDRLFGEHGKSHRRLWKVKRCLCIFEQCFDINNRSTLIAKLQNN